jgi:poly-beta-hydroxyalkanoate depolymerase
MGERLPPGSLSQAPHAARGGHYGVVSGRKCETQIYPLLRNVVLASEV